MATEKRLVPESERASLIRCLKMLHDCDFTPGVYEHSVIGRAALFLEETVDAVVLPYHPRPLLKDRNPFGTDVYCPECGTNLSGYYGDEPLPIVTCFNCGEILDPYKATTKMDGRSEDNA